MRGVPANASGLLAGLNEEATKLLFFVRNGWRAKAQTLNIAGCVASREPKFLSENLIISGENGKGASAIFLFERGRGERVQQIADSINSRLANRQPANAGDPSSTTELV
jgi:hypothetical protein